MPTATLDELSDDDFTLTRGALRVALVDLGEGLDGDYDPDDPADIELLRLDVMFDSGAGFEQFDGGSWCTRRVPTNASASDRRALLTAAMNYIEPVALAARREAMNEERTGDSEVVHGVGGFAYRLRELSHMTLAWRAGVPADESGRRA